LPPIRGASSGLRTRRHPLHCTHDRTARSTPY
jgi:hypothetical protein